ncbi:hypothetical protein LHJ74_25765 [Streptomyces sp. N2-109]|uniref:Tetratricopeptide repeat protein n=1 Tax=Streptomyces gossypii TaxID=2883101 RepID=A0ABT2JZD3_9ACTN|nr:hypothetical protein [Streptomyces gossypii]MCT2593271.1 hypothetical protein [Streptomyces gossypii]
MALPQLEQRLGQAVRARLVTPLGDGRYAFAHDLVRASLCAGLPAEEARRRHRSVVRALERSPALAEHLESSDLARHAYLAVGELDPAAAVEHLLAAARDASGRLALEEAAEHYRRALELVPRDDPGRRATIGLALGTAEYQTRDEVRGRQTFEEVVALARELGDHQLLARAALTLHGLVHPGRPEQLQVDLIDEAHRTLAGRAARPAVPATAARELSVRAVALARRSQDDHELGFSLLARHDAIWTPGTLRERQGLIEELAAVARRAADPELEVRASTLRLGALLEQGDPRCLDGHRSLVTRAQSTALPRCRHEALSSQGSVATLQGRFDEAQAFIDEAYALGEQAHIDHVDIWNHQRWALCQLRGRFDQADELLQEIGEDGHLDPRLIHATTAVQRGDVEVALRYLRAASDASDACVPWLLPLWLRFQAQTAAASGDPQLCETARAAIKPFLGQWAVSIAGFDIHGPFVLWSARLDAAQGRWEAAVEGFSAARRSADLLRARPWSLEARAGLAEALARRGAAGDAAAAGALLDEVAAEAGELGKLQLLARVGGTGSAGTGAAPDIGPGSGRGAESGAASVFRFDGSVWTLGFAGRTVHLPDAKGLHDLHVLLGAPGSRIAAVRLLAPGGDEVVAAAGRMGSDTVLDREAEVNYRRHLARLDEETERALNAGDDRRAARLDRERATLLDELRSAAGLAGRPRRLGDEAERVRKTVTARIRHTLRRLDEHHPELAGHLRATVSTGTTCCYRETEGVPWLL